MCGEFFGEMRSTGYSGEQSWGKRQTKKENPIGKELLWYDSCMSRDGFAIIPRRNRFPLFQCVYASGTDQSDPGL